MQANIIVKDKNGKPMKANLSVAVSDWALTGSEVLNQATVQEGYPLGTTAFDDHIYSRTKLAAEKLNENLIGIYAAQDWQMFYASPDKEGTFFIAMPHFYGDKTIQFLGYPNPDINIQLEEPIKSAPAVPLVYTEGILKYLQLSQQRKKIFQLYKTLETNLNNEKADEEIEPIQPDRTIRTEEYESFEDIATFIREISSPVAFTLDRKKNLYSARMYNPAAQTFYPNDPMFIIDGKVTRNADFAARLKLNQIEQIDLYYNFDKLFENFLVIGSSGVISITTKSGVLIPEEEEKDIFKINGLQYPAAFPEFRPEQVNNNAHQPFFRPQLFWNPSVETNEQGQARLQFFQSDDISTFRIEIVAQSEDGTIGVGKKEYVVSWK
ncbi:MAG: hypothetical protein IPJ74_07500 [Saprospiraceae bacterium]|nr:hypothetical protein [Saprospiraceae bacterium]